MPTKVCSKCKVEKDVGEFYTDKNRSNGLTSRCKSCAKAVTKEWYAANRDWQSERGKAYRDKNAMEIKRRHKDYYESNKTRLLAASVAYARSHPEKARERSRKYAATERGRTLAKVNHARYGENLTDSHVKMLLAAHSGTPRSSITPELIALKREQLLLYRAIKQLNSTIKDQHEKPDN